MLKAIIVDNEAPAIDVLKILLEESGQVRVVGGFLKASDALDGLQLLQPDVAFLDIEMPEIDGLELAENILAVNGDVEIVFVTAYDQYALEAFRVNALDYLLKPLSRENVEKTVDRLLKRKKSLPASRNHPVGGRIYCFGKLSVYGTAGGQPIRWRTAKAEELFAYMLQHREKEVSKWKICDALWPESETEKIDIYLHTTIYKMKKALTAAKIKFDFKFINGCYWLSLNDAYIDAAEFDSLLESGDAVTEETRESGEKAFSLYQNGYLEEHDYPWLLPEREEYYRKFYDLATSLAEYYMLRNNHTDAARILQKLLEQSPLDEPAHEMLLKLYFIKKDRVAFVTHYNAMCELFQSELGIEPGDSIKALYRSALCG
jgi:two-component system LytT family response regulator